MPRFLLASLQDAPNQAGEPAEVAGPSDQCKAKCGGAVTVGAFLGPDNQGRLIVAPQEAAPGTADQYVIAQALQAGAADEIIQVYVLTPLNVSTE